MTHTERDRLGELHRRYSRRTQAGLLRYVVAEHVRIRTGFSGMSYSGGTISWSTMRTIDFVAQDTWETSGLHLHGHEVKTSRADWLRELADPGKAAAGSAVCDRWWIVVPDRKIIHSGELPDAWGLMALSGGTLRVFKQAAKLDRSEDRAFQVALLRATQRTWQRRRTE